MKSGMVLCGCAVAVLMCGSALAQAQDGADMAELAKQLANPVASMISVPFQYNYDENFGADDAGSRHVLNIQPVVPFALSADWNLITRTIMPLVDADDVPPGTSESGLGDITASQFFSPRATPGGWILGLGPVELIPTATEDVLGGEQWGLGPTFVGLKQEGAWTYGILANHIWSVAGDDDRADVNATFLQPFLAYVTKTHTTLTLNGENSYDWESEEWSVPLNAIVSQMLKVGSQPVSVGAGVRYWADSPDNGPEDWGARLVLTLLYPK